MFMSDSSEAPKMLHPIQGRHHAPSLQARARGGILALSQGQHRQRWWQTAVGWLAVQKHWYDLRLAHQKPKAGAENSTNSRKRVQGRGWRPPRRGGERRTVVGRHERLVMNKRGLRGGHDAPGFCALARRCRDLDRARATGRPFLRRPRPTFAKTTAERLKRMTTRKTGLRKPITLIRVTGWSWK